MKPTIYIKFQERFHYLQLRNEVW